MYYFLVDKEFDVSMLYKPVTPSKILNSGNCHKHNKSIDYLMSDLNSGDKYIIGCEVKSMSSLWFEYNCCVSDVPLDIVIKCIITSPNT